LGLLGRPMRFGLDDGRRNQATPHSEYQFSFRQLKPNAAVSGLTGLNIAHASAPANSVLSRLRQITSEVSSIRTIQSLVVASVHEFVATNFYSLAFSNAAQSIFRCYQVEIDVMLQQSARDVLEKIPSITGRLAQGDGEAISQAMASCRRMIDAFVDAVQAGSDEEVELGGKKARITADKVLNRLEYHLNKKCPEVGRRERLNKNVRAIWGRVCAGVHSDVTTGEARALFLQTYLTLGEILEATKAPRLAISREG
jgi:hypothetical protein